MSPLHSRRASSAAAAKTKPSLVEEEQRAVDDEDPTSKEKTLALTSIKSCYRNAFYSTAVDVFTEFTQPHQQEYTTISFILKLVQSLHIFGMGLGLYQLKQALSKSIKTLSSDDLLHLFHVLKRMWMMCSIVLTLGSMATSTDFSDYLGNDPLYYLAPMIVLVTSIIVSIVCIKWNAKQVPPIKANSSSDERALQLGFFVLRNMALCVGALSIAAVTLLVDNFLDPSTPMIEKVGGLSSVAEPAAIAYLLARLRRELQQVLFPPQVTTSKDRLTLASVDAASRKGLYKAQQGFYNKVASVFYSAATTKLVSPYLDEIKTRVVVMVRPWLTSIKNSRDWCSASNYKIVRTLAGCD